ncbi:MAG TPA: ferredoxin [Firmicutes bacterium]|nr:ferredoxin [Bacillota bacterium]
MQTVNVTINGIESTVPSHFTILEAARAVGIKIPTLCFLKDLNETGACRVCVVEVEGAKSLVTACNMKVTEGMKVKTNSKVVQNARKTTVELLLANHNIECTTCIRNGQCELQDLSNNLGCTPNRFEGIRREKIYRDDSYSLVRDTSKCVLCGRCVSACREKAGVEVLAFNNRGFETYIGPGFEASMSDAGCIFCGQCIVSCPTAALQEKTSIPQVTEALNDPSKTVVFQVAPAVRAALGEEFGLPFGTRVNGKIAAALRRIGNNKAYVFDTNFGADLTIMEEANELLHRIQEGGVLPMITSCSPGWIRLAEMYRPAILPNLSSCKSPQQMFGAITKSYWAEKNNIDKSSIYCVSVMPCTSKKSEINRPQMEVDGIRDVDASITTRELARLIKMYGIDFVNLPDEAFDQPLGQYTGAGTIFGATGGVMEAALRTAADTLSGQSLEKIEYEAVRGVKGVKEASVTIGDTTLNIAVVHGGKEALKLVDQILSGEKDYHFVEVMGCSGGCVTGGGQPHVHCNIINQGIDVRVERAKALYEDDRAQVLRKSHENPAIKAIYDEYLGKPNSHLAHEILHTTYGAKEMYVKKIEE